MREIILIRLDPSWTGEFGKCPSNLLGIGEFWTPVLVEGPPGARKIIRATHFASMESESAMMWGMESWEHLLEDVA
tara:strand:- start:564 stop:791 length:228 start_codon:yes stop_codon:yes gene_type:complete